MNVLYYFAYVIHRYYIKINSPGYDNWTALILGIGMLNFFTMILLVDLISPGLGGKIPDNIYYIGFAGLAFLGIHFYIFRNKSFWLNKFSEFDKLPKASNTLYTSLTSALILLVLGLSITRLLKIW